MAYILTLYTHEGEAWVGIWSEDISHNPRVIHDITYLNHGLPIKDQLRLLRETMKVISSNNILRLLLRVDPLIKL